MSRVVPFVDHEIGYKLLQKLIAYSEAGLLEIPAVVTTRENGRMWWPGVQEVCSKARIPLLTYDASFSVDHSLLQADWFLLLSWKHIIPISLIELPSEGVINLHYSLLPSYRGVYPVNWAIANGERKAGFTFHFVNQQIDDGEIFMQAEVPVRLSDTARTLQSRIDDEVFQRFDEFLERLLSRNHDSQFQTKNRAEKRKEDYFSRERFEKACQIDLNKTYRGLEFFNLLRGLTFFEDSKNAYVIDSQSGKRVYINITLKEESE